MSQHARLTDLFIIRHIPVYAEAAAFPDRGALPPQFLSPSARWACHVSCGLCGRSRRQSVDPGHNDTMGSRMGVTLLESLCVRLPCLLLLHPGHGRVALHFLADTRDALRAGGVNATGL